MSYTTNALLRAMLALSSALTSAGSFAIGADRDQPIYVQSDTATRNENTGITVYQGDVNMKQGSTRILADKVTIYTVNNEITRILAVGNPAHYQEKPDEQRKTVVAEANTIDYLLNQDKLNLIENASLDQEGTTMTGKRIEYNIKASEVKASSNSSSGDGRIHMVIQPKKTTAE